MIRRNTFQKKLVMDVAIKLCHPTADEVYACIFSKYPTVSRATVYRNLNLLVAEGMLSKVEMPDGADCFDKTLLKHYHMRCRVCGRVEDAELPYQSALLEKLGNTHGFFVEEHDILLKGVCRVCAKLQ